MWTAAIVGCGDIAGGYDERSAEGSTFSHAGVYRARSSVIQLVACADPNEGRRRQFQQYWGVEHGAATVRDLLARGPFDVVSVCTPDGSHYEDLRSVIGAAAARIIWAEKPLTSDVKTADEIVTRAIAHRIGIRLTNQRRWEREHRRLRDELRSGLIGELTAVTGYYVKGVTHVGTTLINTLRFLVGEIEAVQAVGPAACGCYPNDPSLSAILWFSRELAGMIHGIDGASYRYSLFEFDLVGTEGRVRVVNNGDEVQIERPVEYGHYSGFSELRMVEQRQTTQPRALLAGFDSILDALAASRVDDVSEALEGARDLAVVAAIRESSAAGGQCVPVRVWARC